MSKLILVLIMFVFHIENHANTISVSGGIAHPSYNSSIDQNPAGYVFNTKTKVVAEALFPKDGDAVLGGHGFMGNGSFGASLGVRNYPESDKNIAHYGIGVNFKNFKTAFGFSGKSDVDESDHDFIAGFLFGIDSQITVGLTAYGLSSGPNGYGAGIKYTLSPSAAFVTDVSTDKDLGPFRIKPGLTVTADKVSLSISYGIDTKKEGIWGGAMTDKFSAAGSIIVSDSFVAQVYYRQLSHIYGSITYIF
jgi:hypothetical protein